jgi:hypothetical protein
MKDLLSIRYIGYKSLPEGGRCLDFSYGLGVDAKTIAVEVPLSFLEGPQRIAIQEASGICYETLRVRLQTDAETPPARFGLTAADIAQHRHVAPVRGSRFRKMPSPTT